MYVSRMPTNHLALILTFMSIWARYDQFHELRSAIRYDSL